MKLKLIIASILVLLISGCSTSTKYVTRVETVTVYKPVYTPPEELQDLEVIPRPDLVTNYLENEDKTNPGHVVKVTIESIAQLRTYAEQLETQNGVYREAFSKPADIVPEPERSVTNHESDKPFK